MHWLGTSISVAHRFWVSHGNPFDSSCYLSLRRRIHAAAPTPAAPTATNARLLRA